MADTILTDLLRTWRQYIQNGWIFSLGIVFYYLAYRLIKNLGGKKRRNKRLIGSMTAFAGQILMVFIFAVYLFFVINLTLFSREEGSRDGLNLTLSITAMTSSPGRTAAAVENFFMLMPGGMMLPILLKRLRGWLPGICMGVLVSLLIETIQRITGRGYFELEDIVLNGAGAVIGYLGYRLGTCALKEVTENERAEEKGAKKSIQKKETK